MYPEATRIDRDYEVIAHLQLELETPYEPDPLLDELSPGQRALYAIWWIRAEVNNGGFDQCCWNSTAFLLPTAVDGAALVGAPAWSALFAEVMALFGSPFPLDRAVRQDQLDAFDDARRGALDSADERMYELDRVEDETSLDACIERYVDTHPEEFHVDAPDEETAAETLLGVARRCFAEPYFGRNEPGGVHGAVTSVLEEAIDRSRRSGTGRAAEAAEALLAQVPVHFG